MLTLVPGGEGAGARYGLCSDLCAVNLKTVNDCDSKDDCMRCGSKRCESRKRQLRLIEDLSGMQVGDGHLHGGGAAAAASCHCGAGSVGEDVKEVQC